MDKKKQLRSVTFEKLAAAARIQKTYLSRVLNGDIHLSEDQLFRAGEFLGFTPDEHDYTQLLLQQDRSDVPERRALIAQKLEGLAAKYRTSGGNLSFEPTDVGPGYDAYFLDPVLQLVHMFLCLPRYRRDLPQIAAKLGISEDRLSAALASLMRSKLVALDGGEYQVLRETLHLDGKSELYRSYKTLMRLKALEHASAREDGQRFEFSVVFSADQATRERLRADILDLIKRAEVMVGGAKQEEVYQMQVDLFRWS